MSELIFLVPLVLLALYLIIRLIVKQFIGDYKKRDKVMNSSEKELYIALQRELGSEYIILSKVRIEDFVKVTDMAAGWGDIQSLRGRIKSRHTDFLICDLETTEPLMAIELEGSSRDIFPESLYKKIGLPMARVKVGSNFAVEAEKIKNILSE